MTLQLPKRTYQWESKQCFYSATFKKGQRRLTLLREQLFFKFIFWEAQCVQRYKDICFMLLSTTGAGDADLTSEVN